MVAMIAGSEPNTKTAQKDRAESIISGIGLEKSDNDMITLPLNYHEHWVNSDADRKCLHKCSSQ
jgi:hypothetical protein